MLLAFWNTKWTTSAYGVQPTSACGVLSKERSSTEVDGCKCIRKGYEERVTKVKAYLTLNTSAQRSENTSWSNFEDVHQRSPKNCDAPHNI